MKLKIICTKFNWNKCEMSLKPWRPQIAAENEVKMGEELEKMLKSAEKFDYICEYNEKMKKSIIGN